MPLGDWVVRAGQVSHQGEIGVYGSVAIVDAGSPNGLVQATVGQPGDWAGIVFRYIDATSYWAVASAASFGTWNLVKVVEGVPTDVGNIGSAPSDPGTVIGILLDGDVISVAVNGAVVYTLVDSDYVNGTGVGLYAGQTTANTASWEDLLVIPGVVGPRPGEVDSAVPTPTIRSNIDLELVIPTPTPAEDDGAGP